MSSLYDKRAVQILTETPPTATAAESESIDISSDHTVRLLVAYQAGGAGKTLRIYPEVRVGGGWFPALSAAIDTSGATVDAEGYVAARIAAPYLALDGLNGVDVPATIDVPVPAGDRFRVRVLEAGYSALEPAQITVVAVPSRGAS